MADEYVTQTGRVLTDADLERFAEEDDASHVIAVVYRNYRGDVATRNIVPVRVRFGTSEHHERPQWLLECFDVDKRAARTFALGECDFDSAHW